MDRSTYSALLFPREQQTLRIFTLLKKVFMKFECDGTLYDSDDMLQPRVQDRYILAIFITQDYGRVFAVYMSPDVGERDKPIRGHQMERIAKNHAAPELQMAVERERVIA